MKLNKAYYKTEFTYEQAISKGYRWVMNVKKLELLSEDKQKSVIKLIEKNAYLICQPREQNSDDFVGLYQELLPDLPFDLFLTPDNSSEKGYEFVGEVKYDREAPIEAMKDITDLILKKGYKLGQQAGTMAQMQGLYAPLKK